MATVNEKMTALANAIRVASGTNELLSIEDMVNTALNLPEYDIGSWLSYVNGETDVLKIPEGVKTLRDRAFAGQMFASQIVLPESAVSLGDYAIGDCRAITEIDLKNVESLGYRSFYNCPLLSKIIMPLTLKSMGYYVFQSCSQLTELTFRNGMDGFTIDPNALAGSSITTINCPWGEGEVGGAPWGANATTINYFGLMETFDSNSWEQIANACKNNMALIEWKPGDHKTMTIAGEEWDVYIIGRDHDIYSDGSGTAPLTFLAIPTLSVNWLPMHETDGAVNWSECDMRTIDLPARHEEMPSEVRDLVRKVNKLTYLADGSALETTEDKLFLLSSAEVGDGGATYAWGTDEGYPYDNIGPHGDRWLRSPVDPEGAGYNGFATPMMGSGVPTTQYEYAFGFCF